jgi:hypothetical protein
VNPPPPRPRLPRPLRCPVPPPPQPRPRVSYLLMFECWCSSDIITKHDDYHVPRSFCKRSAPAAGIFVVVVDAFSSFLLLSLCFAALDAAARAAANLRTGDPGDVEDLGSSSFSTTSSSSSSSSSEDETSSSSASSPPQSRVLM